MPRAGPIFVLLSYFDLAVEQHDRRSLVDHDPAGSCEMKGRFIGWILNI